MTDTPESFEDQLWRLHEIANGDRDCDMSENDLNALRALLMNHDESMMRPIHQTIPTVEDSKPRLSRKAREILGLETVIPEDE